MWFVYLARCGDDSIYTGISQDPVARIAQHNSGKGSKYCRSRLPVRLAYTESCLSMGDALRRELEVKSLRRKQKEQLISDYGPKEMARRNGRS